jgi:hypothetical protein
MTARPRGLARNRGGNKALVERLSAGGRAPRARDARAFTLARSRRNERGAISRASQTAAALSSARGLFIHAQPPP